MKEVRKLFVKRAFRLPGLWSVLSYYTQSPEAPDSSGRILVAGADLKTRQGSVYVLNSTGEILHQFGTHPVESGFFHTGFWQTWSPDCRYVYFQSGSLKKPEISRYELATGRTESLTGDMEGAPPDGEPLVGALMGMLYAAGYGYGRYMPEIAPVPFEERDHHGVLEYDFQKRERKIRLSVNDFLSINPDRERLEEWDRELRGRNHTPAGLTLMCYCVRWSPDASRMLIHFGNHCVDPARGEPKILYLYTCRRDFSDLRLALDLCRGGVHWSFQPDNTHLVGYATLPGTKHSCMASVRYDGTDLHKLCSSSSGGHPSVSRLNPQIGVTDSSGTGNVEFWDLKNDRLLASSCFPHAVSGEAFGVLRNEFRICHHPVFSRDGKSLFINILENGLSHVAELHVPEELL